MAKIRYPSDLHEIFVKMYETGKLYLCLREGEVLNSPIARVWKGKIDKTSRHHFQEVVSSWQRQWDIASSQLAKYRIKIESVIPVIGGKECWQYRQYNRVIVCDAQSVFCYLGKEKELKQFLSYRDMLAQIDVKFIELLYNSKRFREWIYRLSDNLATVPLKEEEHTSAQWAGILLQGIIDFCKNVPREKEYSRNVYLPFLHSKFLEQNIAAIREIYGIVTGEEVANKEELAKKLNISFGDVVFHVVCNGKLLHLDVRQLNEQFTDNPPAVLLLSENDKPMRALQTKFGNIVAIGGVGWAIGQLFEKCLWTQRVKRIYYWGDCDMAGYGILNMVRGYRRDVVSILMDNLDIVDFTRVANDSRSMTIPDALVNLTKEEKRACEIVKKEQIRVEQERIETKTVEEAICKIR